MTMDRCPLYERPDVQRLTGKTIRPGGLALTKRALTHANLPTAARVLDVGCGAGATVAHLASLGLRATGLDPSATLLRQADGHLCLSQGRGECLPFVTSHFDALLAECCLSLMDNAAAALSEFARVLRPGGALIISDMLARRATDRPGLQFLSPACCVRGAFTRSQIEMLLAEVGFDILLWEDQSEALKQLTVQIIWEYGSLANFWSCTNAGGAGVEPLLDGLRAGYFLLLAKRGAKSPEEETKWKS